MPKITFTEHGVDRVAILPGTFNKLAQPWIQTPDGPTFSSASDRLEWLSKQFPKEDDLTFSSALDRLEWLSDQYPHEFVVDGNEIVIKTS